jgi:hypothetical protein
MAPKARTLPINDRPSVQDVRTAVRHLLELAATAEGLGLELGELAVWNGDDARTLNSVVRLLLDHRARQRDAQRDSVHVHLVEQLRDTYRRARAEGMSVEQLKDYVAERIHVLGHAPDKTEQRLLAVAVSLPHEQRTERNRTISDLGGPVETANARVGSLMNRSGRALADRLSHKESLPWARIAFGRYLTESVAQAYAQTLFRWVVKDEGACETNLAALRTIDEHEGCAIDVLSEDLFCTTFATRAGYVRFLLDEMPAIRGQAAERYRLGFWAVVA